MKANINNNPLKVVNKLPFHYKNTINYSKHTDIHDVDGWRNVVKPSLSENQKLGDLFYDEANNVVTWSVLDLNTEEIDAKNKKYIISKYENHKRNGWIYYQDFRADIVLSIEKNEITEIDAFSIEDFLKSAFDKISNTGDWKTAYFVLNSKETEDTLLLDYKVKALTIIGNYINENYDD